MPSRKKSKTSFDVPQEVQNRGQAEWVYRSDETPGKTKSARVTSRTEVVSEEIPVTRTPPPQSPSEPVTRPHRPRRTTTETHSAKSEKKSTNSSGILDLTAKTISSGFETMSNATLLGTRIALAPFRAGMWMIRLGR
jgi:hypothetical protein